MTEPIHTNACFLAHMGVWCMDELKGTQLYNMIMNGTIQVKADQGGISTGELLTKQENGILIVPISGMTMRKDTKFGGTSTARLKKVLQDAKNDDSVKGILLLITSPGGHTDGLDELAQVIKEVNAVKPIFTHSDGSMTSAAYWLGSQATKIAASRMAIIGSLGTLLVINDFSEHFKKQGVKVWVFNTGKFKGIGTPGTALTKEQQVFFQNFVDEINGFFKQAVMEARGFDQKKVDSLFDGSFVFAEKAKELGLIDVVQSFEETVAELEAFISNGGSDTSNSDHDPDIDEDKIIIEESESEVDAVAKAKGFDTIEAEIKQSNSSKKENENMSEPIKSIAEMKSQYSNFVSAIEETAVKDATAAIQENAVAAERSRVKNWLDFNDVNPKAVKEGIEGGKDISISEATTFAVNRKDVDFKNALADESPADVDLAPTKNAKELADDEAASDVAAAEKYL